MSVPTLGYVNGNSPDDSFIAITVSDPIANAVSSFSYIVFTGADATNFTNGNIAISSPSCDATGASSGEYILYIPVSDASIINNNSDNYVMVDLVYTTGANSGYSSALLLYYPPATPLLCEGSAVAELSATLYTTEIVIDLSTNFCGQNDASINRYNVACQYLNVDGDLTFEVIQEDISGNKLYIALADQGSDIRIAIQAIREWTYNFENFQSTSALSDTIAVPYVDTPEAPQDLTASNHPETGCNLLTWTTPIFSWVFPVNSYNIYRSVNGSAFDLYTTIPGTGTITEEDASYNDCDLTGIPAGALVCYRISTNTDQGSSGFSNIACTNVVEITRVEDLSATGSHDYTTEGSIDFSFKAPLTIEGATPVQYAWEIRDQSGNVLVLSGTAPYNPDPEVYVYVSVDSPLIQDRRGYDVIVWLVGHNDSGNVNGQPRTTTVNITSVPFIPEDEAAYDGNTLSFNVYTWVPLGQVQNLDAILTNNSTGAILTYTATSFTISSTTPIQTATRYGWYGALEYNITLDTSADAPAGYTLQYFNIKASNEAGVGYLNNFI